MNMRRLSCTSRFSRSCRSLLAGSLAACVLAGFACSDESFTPDECEDPPTYDIREASRGNGAVKEDGIIADSPLSAEEQRRLQKLADDGCITLPTEGYSLNGAGDQLRSADVD